MQHDFTLAPNGTQTIDVAGRFFKYKSGTGKIRVRATKGGYIDLLPGQGVENEEFTSLTISDRTGLPNVGVLLAGDFSFRDETISGQVEVISGERVRTDQNRAFIAYANGAGNAGCIPHQQLWNPAGSGRNLIVEQMVVFSTTAQLVRITFGTAALSTISNFVQSKKLGGAVGSIEARQQSDLAAMQGTLMLNTICKANEALTIKFATPLLVPPGKGVMTVGSVVASDLPSNFEYYEDLV